ncbi:unnamed protein product [Amoebophrya sp. A120]|nr:unnamed protein product [Amoebophrya sp. A120]|eukprot:GSA120T00023935001.1
MKACEQQERMFFHFEKISDAVVAFSTPTFRVGCVEQVLML